MTHYFDAFAIIEVPASQANAADFQGISVDGAIIVQSRYIDDFSLPYFAHEITHQWWGVSVSHAGSTGRYLFTESLAQWAAGKFVEQTEGTAAAAEFRKSGFGGGAAAYFDLVAAGADHRLLDLPSSGESLPIAWTKGMFMLDALERSVGLARFQAALTDRQQLHAHATATWDDFWKLTQSVAGNDLGNFSRTWLDQTGAPEYTATWRQDSDGVVTVTVNGSGMAPGENIVVAASNLLNHRFARECNVAGAPGVFTFVPGFEVKEIAVDPEYRSLHWTPEFRDRAGVRAPYTHADRLREHRQYEEAIRLLDGALKSLPEPDNHAAQFLYEYELARIAMEQERYEDAGRHAANALAAPARDSELLPWLYIGLAQAAKRAGKYCCLEGLCRARRFRRCRRRRSYRGERRCSQPASVKRSPAVWFSASREPLLVPRCHLSVR